jgi:hypothetical protein
MFFLCAAYQGLSAEEVAAIKQARKEAEASKKKEEQGAAGDKKQQFRYRPYAAPGWGALAVPAMGGISPLMMPQQ